MKRVQIILYNQLREAYLHDSCDGYLYMHHIGKINFQGRELKLNTASKIIDYAGGKNFVETLSQQGKYVEFSLVSSFIEGILLFSKKHSIQEFCIVQPVEEYVYKNFVKIQKKLDDLGIHLLFLEDRESFFLTHDAFTQQYEKPPVMEFFYRFIRKKENILIDSEGKPEGGKWNYDAENRKFDKKHEKTWNFSLKKNKGLIEAQQYYKQKLLFDQPTTRSEALELLEYFIIHHLDNFGRLEDAMYQDDPYVHHSFLSTSINYGFLSPREVVQAIENSSTALNNKEGFIRQILGWREYMYHFFCHYKDTIYTQNFLNHNTDLPSFFWEKPEESRMNCLATTLKQVQSENLSHHIQRLMIIGNYSLLRGVNPHELNHWFFEYYSDAFEWVVTPNVLGMSQYADGGKLATKPYIASANYINKMSDYCQSCFYNPKEKDTPTACPFNYLYWNFVSENKEVFQNGRQHFVIKNLEKIDIPKIKQLKEMFFVQEKISCSPGKY